VTVGISSAVLAPGRTWVLATTSGFTATGYLPGWAEEDPSKADVPLDRLPAELADIAHQGGVGGMVLPVSHAAGKAEEAWVLVVTIDCKPFPEDERSGPHVPVINIQIVDDCWIRDLDPAGAVALGEKLRALGELIMGPAAELLTAARHDWAEHNVPADEVAHAWNRTASEPGTERAAKRGAGQVPRR